MGSTFFRAPGTKVSYTGYETRNYVSRKARVSRGYQISPTRRDRTSDGWRFWFASPRGPAADAGNWRVDAVRFEEESPPYPPRSITYGPSPQICWPDESSGYCQGFAGDELSEPELIEHVRIYFECSASYSKLWEAVFQSYDSAVAQYGGDNVKPSVLNPDFSFVRMSARNWSGSRTSVQNSHPFLRGGGYSSGWQAVSEPAQPALKSFESTYYCYVPSRGPCNLFTSINRTLFGVYLEFFGDCSYYPVKYGSVTPVWSYFSKTSGNDYPNCQILGPSAEEYPPPSGGGEPPAGFLPGKGPWAYACSCPDFTGEEKPYRVATAPSHRKTRTWGKIRPESPCKHIVSAARSLADEKTLVDWVSTFRADSPGAEFTSSPRIAVDYSYNRAQQRLDSAFRRTTRLNRQAVNKVRRAERSQAALMRNLGSIFRSDRYGAYQGKRDNYGVPLNLEALDNRWDLYKSTPRDQLRQGYSNTDAARGIAAYDREQRRIQQAAAEAALMTPSPRQILIAPTASQRAADPRFWSASDVGYQARYEVNRLIRPNRVSTAATLYVGGTSTAQGQRNGRSIQIPNPNPKPGAPTYVTIPGTRANSRLYGVSLR